MTPYRGVGANTALLDAQLLRDALCGADKGKQELLTAISSYEREMVRYGFAAVRASLTQMDRLHEQSRIKRFAAKTAFRLLDLSPALQKRVLGLGD